MTVASAEVDVDGVLVVNDAADAGHRRVNRLLLLDQGSLLQSFRQRARIGQISDVVHAEVADTLLKECSNFNHPIKKTFLSTFPYFAANRFQGNVPHLSS